MHQNCPMHFILVSTLVPTLTCASVLAQNTGSLRVPRVQSASTTSGDAKAAAKAYIEANKAAAANPSKPGVNSSKPATPSRPGPNASPLERGKYFSRHGAYSEAFNFFNKAAEADPKNPEAYNRRARVEWQLEKNDEALEDVRYAIKLNPDYAEAFCTRAAILNSTGHYHDAIVDTALAVELKPKLKEAYTLQASAYRNLKQYREADELMAKLAAIPDPVSAFDEWTPNIDYTPYITDLQSRVRQHFQAPMGSYPPIVVLFKMHRNGQITEVRVNNPGVATADNAAIAAANAAAPFNQPPAGSPPDFDVFVVLDPPVLDASGMPPDGAPASAQAQAAQQAPTPKAGINWGSVANTGLNTGLNLMRFIHF
ncbi:MAG: tetratricopeptide repeat protein [Cyanobacteria bacterium SZAS-4]|nr:tetratricopeptide repeat protein [Cyanobacteria bacterium SZAS-4]